jgi:hypothetical protein
MIALGITLDSAQIENANLTLTFQLVVSHQRDVVAYSLVLP